MILFHNCSMIIFFKVLCSQLTVQYWIFYGRKAYKYTVTRLYVIFRYPDRVPLTHFVHRAKKLLPWGADFSVEFYAPPEFSGGLPEKYLSTGWARTSDLQIMGQVFYHCATEAMYEWLKDIHSLPFLVFSGRFCSPGSRIFRPYLVVTCLDFPAVSAITVTGSRIFRPYL